MLGINMFSAPSLALKSIMVTLLYWAMVQTVGFIRFQVKPFWFRRCSIDIRPIDFALLAYFAQESRLNILTKNKEPVTAKGTLYKFKLAKDMPSFACPYDYCAKIHDMIYEQHLSKLAQTGLCAPYCLLSFKKTIHSTKEQNGLQANRNSEQDGPKSSIWEQSVQCTE